jgi:hypothetical protein
MAIREIARRLGIESQEMELVFTQTVTVGVSSFTLDDALRDTSETQFTLIDPSQPADQQKVPMFEIPVEFLNRVFFDQNLGEDVDLANSIVQAAPRYVAVGTLSGARVVHIRQIPDKTYNIEVRGIRYTSDLVNPTDSNYVTLEGEEAVLYLAIAITWSFFEDEGKASAWFERAESIINYWRHTRIDSNTSGERRQMGTYAAGGVVESGDESFNTNQGASS